MALDKGAAPYFFSTGAPLCDSVHLSVLAARSHSRPHVLFLCRGLCLHANLGLGHRFVTLLYFHAQLLDKHCLRLPRALMRPADRPLTAFTSSSNEPGSSTSVALAAAHRTRLFWRAPLWDSAPSSSNDTSSSTSVAHASGGPRFGTLLPRALMRPAHPLPWHMRAAARRNRLLFGAPLWDAAQLSWPVALQALTAFTSSSHDAGSHPLTRHMRAAGISASSARVRARKTQMICLLSMHMLCVSIMMMRVPCAERVWEPGYGREGGDSSHLSLLLPKIF